MSAQSQPGTSARKIHTAHSQTPKAVAGFSQCFGVLKIIIIIIIIIIMRLSSFL